MRMCQPSGLGVLLLADRRVAAAPTPAVSARA